MTAAAGSDVPAYGHRLVLDLMLDLGKRPHSALRSPPYRSAMYPALRYFSVPDDLSSDPLPYHREAKAPYDAYALSLFLGLPNAKSFRTKHQLGPQLRQGAQYSTYFINAANAKNPGARKTTRHALPRKLAQ